MLDNFTYPLIVKKSDGGYGYDSTDMTAVIYRLNTLKCDWIVYVTDDGQSSHFSMVFDVSVHVVDSLTLWLNTTFEDSTGSVYNCCDRCMRHRALRACMVFGVMLTPAIGVAVLALQHGLQCECDTLLNR